jgi:hypothetical protein
VQGPSSNPNTAKKKKQQEAYLRSMKLIISTQIDQEERKGVFATISCMRAGNVSLSFFPPSQPCL